MSNIVTHLGQNLNWKAYKNGHNRFTITFTEDGSAFDISSYVFVLNIRVPGSSANKLQLTEGSGITNGGVTGVLTIELSQTQASTTLPGSDYFYEIVYTVNSEVSSLFQGSLQLSSETNPASTSTSVSASVSLSGSAVSAAVSLSSATYLITTNRQTDDYTLVLSDAGKLVEMNVASSNNLTVPPNSSVAFPVGSQIIVSQYGAGQTTILAGSGVTIRSSGGNVKITGQYSGVTLVKIATNEWYLFGDLTV